MNVNEGHVEEPRGAVADEEHERRLRGEGALELAAAHNRVLGTPPKATDFSAPSTQTFNGP